MKLFIILFLLPVQIGAQDITGLWTGYLYNDTIQKYLPYELTINENKDKSNGYSHAIILIDGFENIAVKSVQIKKRNGKILVEDEAFIYNNFIEPPPKGIRVFSNMGYSDEDSALVLSGVWNTNRTKEYSALTGSIRLQKQKDLTLSKLITKLHELDLSNTLSFLPVKRENEALAIEPDSDLAKKFEPALIKKEEIKDIPITVPSKDSSPGLQPKLKEVVLTTSPSSIQKSKSIPLPKEKPLVIAPPQEIVKKSFPVSQIKPKEKQIVIVSSPPIIKQQPVSPPKLPEKEVAVSLPPPVAKPIPVTPIASAVDLATRKTETIKSVLFKSDSLVLTLYDNGEIDGDTVSVVMNGKVIMAQQGLTSNAITKTIYITPDLGDSLQLIMYAENLGSIPPNTGLLILQDGDDRYEIRFRGIFKKIQQLF